MSCFLHDLTVYHRQHAVGTGKETVVMRDDQGSLVEFKAQAAQKFDDSVGVDSVKVSGRLVSKQYHRVEDQCAGDGNPLLLSARQLSRQVIQSIGQTETIHQNPQPLLVVPRVALYVNVRISIS